MKQEPARAFLRTNDVLARRPAKREVKYDRNRSPSPRRHPSAVLMLYPPQLEDYVGAPLCFMFRHPR